RRSRSPPHRSARQFPSRMVVTLHPPVVGPVPLLGPLLPVPPPDDAVVRVRAVELVVMQRAQRHAVADEVAAALRDELDVVGLQVARRATPRMLAAVAVALEDRLTHALRKASGRPNGAEPCAAVDDDPGTQARLALQPYLGLERRAAAEHQKVTPLSPPSSANGS